MNNKTTMSGSIHIRVSLICIKCNKTLPLNYTYQKEKPVKNASTVIVKAAETAYIKDTMLKNIRTQGKAPFKIIFMIHYFNATYKCCLTYPSKYSEGRSLLSNQNRNLLHF